MAKSLSLPLIDRRSRPHAAWEIVLILVGCLIMALGFRLFMNANQVVAGGVVGVATILTKFHIDPAHVQFAINLPILIAGFLLLGKPDGMRSLLGSFALPFAIFATKNVPVITHTPLLAAIFGGVTYGVGLGIVLLGRGSVGGYSLVALVMHRRLHMAIPSCIFIFDALTIIGAGCVFGPEMALYGLIAAFVMRRSVESMITGFSRAFMALIISNKLSDLKERILVDLNLGMTVLNGRGGYTDEEKAILCVVLGQAEVPLLRQTVKEVDPHAFVVVTHASEVLGQGFH